MHILILPSFYPTDMDPVSGKFFQDQAQALSKSGLTVGVAFCEGRSLRRGLSCKAILTHHFQTTYNDENGLPTVRIFGWNTIGQLTLGAALGSYLMARAANEYIKRYG